MLQETLCAKIASLNTACCTYLHFPHHVTGPTYSVLRNPVPFVCIFIFLAYRAYRKSFLSILRLVKRTLKLYLKEMLFWRKMWTHWRSRLEARFNLFPKTKECVSRTLVKYGSRTNRTTTGCPLCTSPRFSSEQQRPRSCECSFRALLQLFLVSCCHRFRKEFSIEFHLQKALCVSLIQRSPKTISSSNHRIRRQTTRRHQQRSEIVYIHGRGMPWPFCSSKCACSM